MEKKLKKLVGRYCKIVVKSADDKRAEVITGKLDKVSYRDGFLYLTTPQGPACYKIECVVAVKRIRRIIPVD